MAYTRTIKRPTRRTKSKKPSIPFLPESVQAFLARRLVDITAGAFLAAGLFVFVALMTYAHTDPSWNTAGPQGQDIQNWLGRSGAWVSDLLAQTIGVGGLVLSAGFIAWSLRLFRRHTLNVFALRVTALLMSMIFISVAFAQVPSGDWFVHPYLGSTSGEMILNKTVNILPAGYMTVTIVGIVLGVTGFCFAAAVTLAEVKYALSVMKYIAVSLIVMVWNVYTGFMNWIRHYNDPSYAPKPYMHVEKPDLPQKPTPEKIVEYKQDPDISTGEVEQASFVQATTPEKASSIPVVKTQTQSIGGSASQKQKNLLYEGEWTLPESSLLQDPPTDIQAEHLNETALRKNAELLQNVLSDFKIDGEIVSIHPGPVVTLYELEPAPGTKSSRVIGLSDDIARSMSAVSVRVAVVPGRNVIGIELPNKERQIVYMQELLASRLFEKTKAHLPLILGKDIAGQPILADLAKMPHLLVAGTTGSGKSVAVNTMILSLLYRLSPDQCRFIMIDPKMLELSVYDGIPHLLSPVVTEPGKAVVALKWTVAEMESRYRAMSKLGVRNVEGYNKRVRLAAKNGETIMTRVKTGFDPETGKATYEEQPMDLTELPYIVVIVDEFADLMLVAGKDVEAAIQRLAQMARAAGIHLIMATQRPSVDVITGVIKANFPTRISFAVTSKVDSRTILGEGGAEQLLGMGDMLYMAPGGRITRVHGPFVSDKEVEKVVDFLKAQGNPSYVEDITDGDGLDASEVMAAIFDDRGSSGDDQVDELYDKAVALVAREGKASTSFVQRYLQIGYNRAARIIEEMEKQGIISPATKTGKREVLIRDFSDV